MLKCRKLRRENKLFHLLVFVCFHLFIETYILDSSELMENSCPQAANQSYSECVLEYILTNLTQRNQGGTALCRKKPPSPGNIDCAQGERVSFSLIPPVALQLANNFLGK